MRRNARIIKVPTPSQRDRQDLDRRTDLLVATHPAADDLSHTLLRLARTLRELEAYEPGLSAALLRESEQLLQDWRQADLLFPPH